MPILRDAVDDVDARARPKFQGSATGRPVFPLIGPAPSHSAYFLQAIGVGNLEANVLFVEDADRRGESSTARQEDWLCVRVAEWAAAPEPFPESRRNFSEIQLGVALQLGAENIACQGLSGVRVHPRSQCLDVL